MLRGDLMQTGREEDDLASKDGQFTLVGTVLGRRAAGISNDAHNVSAAQVLMLGLEADLAGGLLRLTHDLDLGARATDVVEDELRARRPLGVDPSRHADLDVLLVLAGLQAAVFIHKRPQVRVHLELVRVRVGLLGLAQAVDPATADFKVLL